MTPPANGGKSLEDYRHIPFNLDELALDAAARGLGVAMTDLTLAQESLDRGVLVVPFGQPLKTRGIYRCAHNRRRRAIRRVG